MKTDGKEMEFMVLPGYGKRKLLTYAQSFRDLADTFAYIPCGELQENTQDRETYLWQRRLSENRGLMAGHLNEMAQIMAKVAEESFRFVPLADKRRKQIAHAFRDQGILLKEIYMLQDANDRLQVSVTIRSMKQQVFTVEEIGDFLSVLFDRRLLAEKNSVFFLKDSFETIIFEEEARYSVLTGVAKAVKENEKISGDNYSFLEVRNGSFMMALSDGMGSGEKACRDSELVIELLEKCMESGFSKETAVEMINGALLARCEEENMSTLDICDLNLYTGVLELLKIGSSYTYIKRESGVEQIAAACLPLGIFYKPDMESFERQLAEGDSVIMLSDGVVDSIQADSREELLRDVIGMLNTKNSKEMANNIIQFALHQCQGKIRDDMTVLVLGLWENH